MSFRRKLFVAFLLLAFLPTSSLLWFSYRLATEGADLMISRGVEETLDAADSLILIAVADQQQRLQDDLRRLISSPEVGRNPFFESDSSLAFWVVLRGSDTVASGGTIPAEFALTHPPMSGRFVEQNRLIVLANVHDGLIHAFAGRRLPENFLPLADQVIEGRRSYLSLTRNILPGGKNLLLNLTIVLIVLSLLVSLAAAQLLSRSLSSPLASLVTATQQISRGDLQFRIPQSRGDEIGTLIDNFNTMTSKLDLATKELIAAEREMMWRDSARTIAHEIKNLLTPVNVTLYKVRQLLTESQSAGSNMQHTVDALAVEIDAIADMAKQFSLFAHPAKPNMVDVDIAAVIEQARSLHADSLLSRKMSIDIDSRSKTLRADPDLFRRAVSNLIKNAIEATAADGVISISTSRQDSNWVLEVRDNGSGVDASLDLSRPYVTTKKTGTGLGLAIVRKVCEAHGWTFSYCNLSPGFSARIVMK